MLSNRLKTIGRTLMVLAFVLMCMCMDGNDLGTAITVNITIGAIGLIIRVLSEYVDGEIYIKSRG